MTNRLKAAEILSPPSQSLVEALSEEGKVYLVGGATRALLSGQTEDIKDFDLACSLSSGEVRKKLSSLGHSFHQINHSWNTILVSGLDEEIEISEFKAKSSSIEEDLALRDFTINSIAIDLASGEIIDPLGGVQDLRKSLITSSGEASERITEDPLRLLRLCRFASELDFSVEPKTLKAAKLKFRLLLEVAPERIIKELGSLLCGKAPDRGLNYMRETNLLSLLLPEVERLFLFEQNEHHHEDAYQHTLSVIKNSKPRLENRLAALLHDISKPESLGIKENGARTFYKHEFLGEKLSRSILTRLGFPKRLTESVCSSVKHHMRPIDLGDAGLRRLLRDLDADYSLWRDLKEADYVSCKGRSSELLEKFQNFDQRVEAEIKARQALKVSDLAIGGNELIELGIPRNKQMSQCLEFLLEEVIEHPEKNLKETLISMAKEYKKSRIKKGRASI